MNGPAYVSYDSFLEFGDQRHGVAFHLILLVD